MTIKQWYQKTYPTDEMGENMFENVTFYDALITIQNQKDIYTILGVGDSVIRERIFEELANRLGISYGDVYELWLNQ